jgi:cardiolipin synthase
LKTPNIPNILTILRFLLVPVFANFLCREKYLESVVVFVLAGVTDLLDGYIARKYNMITDWGKVADPLADKLMQLTAVFILSVIKGFIPVGLMLIILIKEALMVIGGAFLYKKMDFVVSANWYGKLATTLLFIAIIAVMLNKKFPFLPDAQFFVIIAFASVIFAFIMYLRNFVKIVRRSCKTM